MDFRLTEEQAMIQVAARNFAQSRIVPIAAEFDASGEFPEATIREMGELGMMGLEVPQEYGGAGLDAIGYTLALSDNDLWTRCQRVWLCAFWCRMRP